MRFASLFFSMLGMSLCLPFVRYADNSMINRFYSHYLVIHSMILTNNDFDHNDQNFYSNTLFTYAIPYNL